MATDSLRSRGGREAEDRPPTDRDESVAGVDESRAPEEVHTLAAIVDASDDAIIAKKLDGTIVAWNHGASRLYGYTAPEVIGQPVSILIPPGKINEVPAILERIRRGERVDSYETIRRTKDGRQIEISLTVSPVRNAYGEVTGASSIGRDITEKKKADRELRELTEELRQTVAELAVANRELEAFSYAVSHDLRSPLRAIEGFSQALVDDYGEQLDKEARQMLTRVRVGAVRMGELIDEILSLSLLARKELKPRPVDLTEMARKVTSDLQAQVPDRPVDVVLEEDLTAYGDPELLRIAITNLFENAWKFTAECAEPRIEFRRERVDGRSAYVVRDNGAGFDMRYSGKLFQPFERLHREDEFPGLGVGLATVQRVVQRHEGAVWAEGSPGEGAAFYFQLPGRNPE